MRRVLSFLGVVSAVPVVIAVPVVTPPSTSPRPVTPHITALPVDPLPATTGVVADSGKRSTSGFTLAGATFSPGSLATGTHVELRTKSHGSWSSWASLPMPDGGPDDDSKDARAAAASHLSATDPLYVGHADGVQARVVDDSGRPAPAPRDLHVVLVDGGHAAADASPGPARPVGGSVAEAAQAQPTIYTRAQWGADERLRTSHPGCSQPSYGSTIKMGFVHHTDGANGYSAADVPGILRSIYAYHVQSNGWCDIGYNFLVDRFGRIWEGRYGGIDRPVIGAHTGGFNTDTFAASMIGTFSSTAPPAAMLAAVEKLFAWKLGSYYLDPHGKATVVAGSFSGSRYATGSKVTFNEISGHRDADTTTCPGNAGYAKLGTIRNAVAQLMGTGFVTPSASPASVRMLSGQTIAVRAGVLGAQSWTMNVTDANGATVKTLTGTADRTAGLSGVWDATGLDGTPVPPGTYTVTLTGADANGVVAIPWSQQVTVTPPVTVTVPPTATYGATVPVAGLAGPNASVTVTVQRGSDPAQTRTVTASPAGAWSTSVTADGDYTFSAAVQGYTSPTVTTKVAPEVTTPSLGADRTVFVQAGSSLALGGTGLPGSTVQVVTTPQGQQASTGPALAVGSDGTWSGGTVTPSAVTAVVAQRDAGTASAPVTVYPVAAPTATGATSGYSRRTFTITGNAGNAPVSVQLFVRAPGASSDTPGATVTAASNGAFTVRGTLPAVSTPTGVTWRIVTSAAGAQFGGASGQVNVQPVFAPTATGRLAGYYGYAIPIAGRAVPGDAVTLWTRPVGGTSWTKSATVRADASTGAFSTSFRLLRDTTWRVTSPSGATKPANVIVRPAIRTPRSAGKNAMVYGWGWAIPGQKVAVYRRPAGTASWRYVGTVTTPSTGRWTGHWHLIYAMDVQVRSHGQTSPTTTIKTK